MGSDSTTLTEATTPSYSYSDTPNFLEMKFSRFLLVSFLSMGVLARAQEPVNDDLHLEGENERSTHKPDGGRESFGENEAELGSLSDSKENETVVKPRSFEYKGVDETSTVPASTTGPARSAALSDEADSTYEPETTFEPEPTAEPEPSVEPESTYRPNTEEPGVETTTDFPEVTTEGGDSGTSSLSSVTAVILFTLVTLQLTG